MYILDLKCNILCSMLDLKCMKIEPKQECCEKCQQKFYKKWSVEV